MDSSALLFCIHSDSAMWKYCKIISNMTTELTILYSLRLLLNEIRRNMRDSPARIGRNLTLRGRIQMQKQRGCGLWERERPCKLQRRHVNGEDDANST